VQGKTNLALDAKPRSAALRAKLACVWLATVLLLAGWMPQRLWGQAAGPAAGGGGVVPQSIRFSGAAGNRAGDTVEAEFRIYAAPEGGEPLWTETQRIAVGQDGKYAVLLGAATQGGLPATVFGAGQARWVGVSIERGPEGARVPLISVPYAMKAADAQTLAGVPAAEFVTQGQLHEAAAAAATAAAAAAVNPDAITGGGTTSALAYWTSATALGSSAIAQGGTAAAPVFGVNLGALAPVATFDVGGSVNARAMLSLNRNQKATATTGVTSPFLTFIANTYATGGTTTNQNLAWHAEPTGNDTAAPSAKLVFAAGTGATTTDTALSIAPSGLMTFAAGQTFPGTGTITGITTTAPLTGSGTSGAVALGLSVPALKTTLNSTYAQVGAANTFAGNQTVTGNLTVSGTVFGQGKTGTAGINGTTSSATTNAAGVTGFEGAATGQVYGVYGSTNSVTNQAAAVDGWEGAATGQVYGVNGATNSTTNFAAGVSGYEGAATGQVWGVAGGTNSATNGAAGVHGNDGATSGVVYGVQGSANSTTQNAAGVSGFENAATGLVFGVYGTTNSVTNQAAAVDGWEGAATGAVYGVAGSTNSTTGNAAGVSGYEGAATGRVYGVSGGTGSTTSGAAGVSGSENAATGPVYGVTGYTASTGPYAAAVSAYEGATTGVNWGVQATSASSEGIGVQGSSPGTGISAWSQSCGSSGCTMTAGTAGAFFTGAGGYLLRGQSAPIGKLNPTYTQVFSVDASGNETLAGNLNVSGSIGFSGGISGQVSNATGNGVSGVNLSTSGGNGVSGTSNGSSGNGVVGANNATSGFAVGVTGFSDSPNGAGVNGFSNAASGGIGVNGNAPTSGIAILGGNQNCGTGGCTYAKGTALSLSTGSGGTLIYASAGPTGSSKSTAATTEFTVDSSGNGYFNGNLNVKGTLSKGGGSFKIDDPLDPEHKYLSHSFVESPDMMNVYNGNVVTDKHGYATVTLPEYFEALNRDFRYQLTVMGVFAQAIVAKKIAENRFVIRTDKPNVEVSWQVTGIRQDAWANANRIPVEEEKPTAEQGRYLHPELFGTGQDKSVVRGGR